MERKRPFISAAVIGAMLAAGGSIGGLLGASERGASATRDFGTAPAKNAPSAAVRAQIESILRSFMRGGNGSTGRPHRRGWSVAEDRRRAKKARNRARNRRAHR